MASKRTNGVADAPTAHNESRVSVDREEYMALLALRELHEECTIRDAKAANRNHDLLATCSAQAKRLIEVDLIQQHQEHVIGMQRGFIELLREERRGVASLEELSEFWRRWAAAAENFAKQGQAQRDEAAKLEPDLFKSWRLWVRDSGKVSRSFAVAGTRGEVEARQPASQAALQDQAVAQLRDQVAAMSTRMQELEGEVNAHKNQRKDKAAP